MDERETGGTKIEKYRQSDRRIEHNLRLPKLTKMRYILPKKDNTAKREKEREGKRRGGVDKFSEW